MVKIVLDTNVLVSAVLNPKGSPARVLDMVADRAAQIVVSPAIVAEYQNVLGRKKFGLSSAAANEIIRSLRKLSIEIVPAEPIRACSDPSDDKFLECAVAAGIPYLVTGNLKHFPKLFKGVRAVTPAVFLQEEGTST